MDGDGMSMAKAEREMRLMEEADEREADPWGEIKVLLCYLRADVRTLVELETEHKRLAQDIHEELRRLTEVLDGQTH